MENERNFLQEKGQIEEIMQIIKKKKREEREKSDQFRTLKISEPEKELNQKETPEIIENSNINPNTRNILDNSIEKRSSVDKNVQSSKSIFLTNNNTNPRESVVSLEGDFQSSNMILSGMSPSKPQKKAPGL